MELVLDSAIRDWVLIPILLMVMFSGMIRSSLSQLLTSETDKDKEEAMVQQGIARSVRLRNACRHLPEASFKMRRRYFCTVFFNREVESLGGPLAMAMDPSQMMGMLKKNAAYSITTMLLLTWVDTVYSGFILAKVPFPLTQKFRGMLQRGVELNDLDVTYVSSSSLYFLAVFGMNGILDLILDKKTDALPPMMMQDSMSPMGKDLNKAMSSEKDMLESIRHSFALDGVEERFLKMKA